MRVVLDTTYVLPCLGMAQADVPRDLLRRLRRAGHETMLSEISVFEAMAIAAKHCAESYLREDDVLTGIAVLASDEGLTKVPVSEPEVCLRSILARRQMTDFVDCVIVATGAWAGNILITEDEEIQGFPVQSLMPTYSDFQVVDHRQAAKMLGL